jgi:hypothetical protein
VSKIRPGCAVVGGLGVVRFAEGVGDMVAAGYVEVRDLLCVTPPSIPEGPHAMTQLVELPPAEAGLQCRHGICLWPPTGPVVATEYPHC